MRTETGLLAWLRDVDKAYLQLAIVTIVAAIGGLLLSLGAYSNVATALGTACITGVVVYGFGLMVIGIGRS